MRPPYQKVHPITVEADASYSEVSNLGDRNSPKTNMDAGHPVVQLLTSE